MMVTEYIPKGNLCDLLHGSSIPVPLDTRVRIAIECAEALGYMHSQMYTQVIHGDIKPSNILLDDGLRAKISDFGISRLVNTENTLYTQNVMGSIGYMDPLFALNGRLTAKSDVYSFGVVLLELVTRRKARNYDGEIGLVENFTKVLAKGARRVREMFDAEIAIPSNMKTIEQIAKLAAKCLRLEHDKRPEMLEVADRLRRLRKALDRGQETETRTPFSWGKITKLVNLGIVAPDETTASLESSSSSTRNVGTFIAGSAVACPLFVLDDLFRASTEVLGHSTVRTTYKATLDSGAELVMRILVGVDLPKEEFEQRAMAIGAVQNEHIAPLQFYYYSNVEKLLVYNHFSRGSLATVLHGDLVCSRATLRWEQRLSISVAAARGVAFIHSLGASSCHGNIRSSNILLTGTDGACVVSEHGLRTLGLFPDASGYQALEVADDDTWVTQKADVYNFGILLLELLIRKAPVKKTQFKEGVDLVRLILNRTMVYEVLDMELLDHENKGERKIRMMRLMHLAIFCCDSDPNLRPTMSVCRGADREDPMHLTPVMTGHAHRVLHHNFPGTPVSPIYLISFAKAHLDVP